MNVENKLIPGLPSGFEDRWNKKLLLKKKLLKAIESNFVKFGFDPLETPSFEISENIGSFLAEDDSNPMSDVFSFEDGDKNITLRYDLSSPLARFVAQNNQELPSVYKRYAIQNVFRNEKAGNARYREFTQADCDIVGNVNPAQANAELCNLIASTLLECGLKKNQFKIYFSNRKIIQGFLKQLGITDPSQETKTIRSIDKLSKIGIKGVVELLQKGRKDDSGAFTQGASLSKVQTEKIVEFLETTMDIKNSDLSKFSKAIFDIEKFLTNKLSQEGVNEINQLLEILDYSKFKDQITTDFSICRGLNYYDGFCVETNLNFKIKNSKGKEVDIGSICSGGQYNKLISRFKGVDIPGTGVSIGVDRLLFAMLQLDQVKIEDQKPVIVCVMDQKYLKNYYEILKILRDNYINSEIFLDSKKNLGKQLTYANKKGCPIAVICGEDELKENKITLKNLLGIKGQNNQITISKENLINEIKKLIG